MRDATAICVVLSYLVGVFANAPARAGVYNFNFGSASNPDFPGQYADGTFTTGAGAEEPGYFLITT
jgi:hypothetical protein